MNSSPNLSTFRFTVLVFLVIAVFFQVHAKDKEPLSETLDASSVPKFIKVNYAQNGQPDALQVSVVTYRNKKSENNGPIIDLVGAVHVGDKTYYDALNALFENYDAVLYELVAPEGTRIPKGGHNESSGFIGNLQLGMKNVLGLTYQLQEVDYTPDNFIHADMSPTEFEASMKNKGESFFSTFLKMWAAGIAQQANGGGMNQFELIKALFSANRELALKVLMAEQFTEMEGMMDTLEGSEGSTLVAERNKKALSVLDKQLMSPTNKRIAIFYGAAHMPDFHERLIRRYGMYPASIKWLDAWDLKE